MTTYEFDRLAGRELPLVYRGKPIELKITAGRDNFPHGMAEQMFTGFAWHGHSIVSLDIRQLRFP